ncbi:hypothetical protein PWG71_05205 [Nocardiopsis sp. N85]|uniref:hypothetical protein n=1 Tax=Nocardiopsis sp. N85 TaxID=3029400 RepID=UPI00237F6CF0|nr:hypothetical protein [Nocardiopsis sp. N85]MDE3720776.1 hypothetical protein [Nocardiopsis sp. N85]
MTGTAPDTGTPRWDRLLGARRAEILDDDGVAAAASADPHGRIAVRADRAPNHVIPDDRDVQRTLGIRSPVVERLRTPDLVVVSVPDRTRHRAFPLPDRWSTRPRMLP